MPFHNGHIRFPRGHAIAYTIEFLYLTLQRKIQPVQRFVPGRKHKRVVPVKIYHLIGIDIESLRQGALDLKHGDIRGKGYLLLFQPLPCKVEILKGAKLSPHKKSRGDHMNRLAQFSQKLGRPRGLMMAVKINEEHSLTRFHFTFQHLPGIDHLGKIIITRERVSFGDGTCRHHHGIRFFLQHPLLVGLDPQANIHVKLVYLACQPASHAGDLLPPRRQSRNEVLAPHFIFLFKDHHPVFSQGGYPGRLQTGRSGPDHHDLFWGLAGVQGARAQVLFFANSRVLDTPQPVPQTHPPDAALIAGNTVADIIGSPLQSLVGEFRVTDEGTNHSDHIRISVLKDLFGKMGIVYPVGAEYRHFDHRSNSSGQGHGVGQWRVHGTFHKVEVMKRPNTEIHEIHLSGGFQTGGDLFAVFQCQSASRVHLIGIQAHPQRKIFPHHLSNRINNLQAEPHPVFKITPVSIFSEIRGRGQELPDERAVAQLEFYTVKASLHCVAGAQGKIIDTLPDIFDLHLLAGLSKNPVASRGRTPDRKS